MKTQTLFYFCNMKKPKVLLGMSGGTDSSVSAMLLQEQGYEVVGVTLWLFDHFDKPGFEPPFVNEARLLAEKLGIKHIVHEAKEQFQQHVLNYFVEEYLVGRTPFPCIVCNKHIKWKILNDLALGLECEKIATGHYVRIVEHHGRKYFAKAVDPDKDQSFFLWNLETAWLDKMVFPLGNFQKSDVREMAAKRGFTSVSKKKDSLGVCFIDEPDYRPFLKKQLAERGITITSGNFVDETGAVIGQHQGFPFYTIGQRRGLNHGQNRALFVTNTDALTNTVYLGDFAQLNKLTIGASSVHFYHAADADPNKEYILKIRYRKQATPCKIEIIGEEKMLIHLLEPLSAVAPGQSAVLFDGDRVIGGGFIDWAE
jgi:tRNA-specific 2-thiouridylase